MRSRYILCVISFLIVLTVIGCTEQAPVCGNGILEPTENAATCCLDAGCPGEQTCENNVCTDPRCNECQYLENHKCIDYECCSNAQCRRNEVCTNNACIEVTCDECEYLENRVCKKYECCSNDACAEDEVCTNNKCESITCEGCSYIDNHQCKQYACCTEHDCEESEMCMSPATIYSYCQFVPGGVCNNIDCAEDKRCSNGRCVDFSCDACEYKSNHKCVAYECCSDSDCENGECKNNVCIDDDHELQQDPNAEFLIITPAALQDAAQRLALRRHDQGINTYVQRVEELSITHGDELVAWVTSFKNSNPALTYLLLIGNDDQIPTFYSNNPVAELETITDYKYSLPKDNLRTLRVGRVPLSDVAEVNQWIDKVEYYEEYTPQIDVFMFGKSDEYNGYGHIHKDLLQESGFSTKMYTPDGDDTDAYDIAAPIIAQELNKGKGFSIFYGHGASDLFYPVFKTTHLDLLTNQKKPTVVFTGGCDTVNYELSKTGIAERFLAYEDGAVAIIGATRNGGYGYQYTLVPNFFSHCTNSRLGDAFNAALKDTYILAINEETWTSQHDQQEWSEYMLERMSLLGDPTMPVCQS